MFTEHDKIIITPSDIIRVSDPFDIDYGRTQDRQFLTKASKRGINTHKQISLALVHGQPHKGQISDFVENYGGTVIPEAVKVSPLTDSISIRAKTDILVTRGDDCLCIEIKPGKKGQVNGGVRGRHILQAILNGLSVPQPTFPDVAIFLYNSNHLAYLNRQNLHKVLPHVRQMAISAANILGLEKRLQTLEVAKHPKRKTVTSQAYLFYPDQLSPEYLELTDLPSIRQAMVEENSTNFQPALKLFKKATKALIS